MFPLGFSVAREELLKVSYRCGLHIREDFSCNDMEENSYCCSENNQPCNCSSTPSFTLSEQGSDQQGAASVITYESTTPRIVAPAPPQAISSRTATLSAQTSTLPAQTLTMSTVTFSRVNSCPTDPAECRPKNDEEDDSDASITLGVAISVPIVTTAFAVTALLCWYFGRRSREKRENKKSGVPRDAQSIVDQ